MKQLKKSFLSKLFLSIRSLRRRFSWHKGVKTFRQFTGSMLSIVRLIADRLNTNHVMATYVFFGSLENLRRKNGLSYTAKYLKACHIYVMQYVATAQTLIVFNSPHSQVGKVKAIKRVAHSCTYDIHVSITGSGIPRILPVYWRTLLRNRDAVAIRIILTVCNLYRVLPYPGKVKLQTITDVFKGNITKDLLSFIPLFWLMVRPKKFTFLWSPFAIYTSGAIVKGKAQNSTSGFILALSSLVRDESLWESITWFFKGAPQRRGWQARNAGSFEHLETLAKSLQRTGIPTMPLGRLAFKDEPGKVRVFAMVDCITQWMLKPLHDWVFTILRGLHTDATFDQDRGVAEIREKILAFDSPRWIYSLDLSAATDKLPVALQRALLNHILRGLGDHWYNLLCNRWYQISKLHCMKYKISFNQSSVRYGTGQPMGAYSSWAMLALTHHFIVQYCASRAGREVWFNEYMILGDDIIILDSKVAKKYLEVMKLLDVGINMSKSLISNNGTAEFAKKLVTPGGRVEGVSLKEFSSLGNAFSNIISLAAKMAARPVNILRLLGYGSLSSGHAIPSFASHSLKSVIHHILICPVITGGSWYDWFSFISDKWKDELSRGKAYSYYLLWELEFDKYKFVRKLGREVHTRSQLNVSERINSLVAYWFDNISTQDTSLFYFPDISWKFDKHRFLPLPERDQVIGWMSSTILEIFKHSTLLTLLTDGASPDLTSRCINWELSFEEGYHLFAQIDDSIFAKVLTRNPRSWVNAPALQEDIFDISTVMAMQEAKDEIRPCRLSDISKYLSIKHMLFSKLYRAQNVLRFDVPGVRYPRVFNTRKSEPKV